MFGRIDPKELNQNVFSMIGEQWMLVTAGTAERCNTMTASWGGLGVLWGKPVATVYIRPQRYTLEFVEREDCFTLSFFGFGNKCSNICNGSGHPMWKWMQKRTYKQVYHPLLPHFPAILNCCQYYSKRRWA